MKTNAFFNAVVIGIFSIFVIVFVSIGVNFYGASKNGFENISMGVNGMTESRCIDGYKFIIGQNGFARQIMDELGHGVRCGVVK
jgi:hypothetical protein